MKKKILLIIAFLFVISCGVKSDPKYNSQNDYNKAVHLV